MITLNDLPPHLRKQAEEQLHVKRVGLVSGATFAPVENQKLAPSAGTVTKEKRSVQLNQTEKRFELILKLRHPNAIIRAHPFRFNLGFKTSYLPDFAVVEPPKKIIIVEVKGGHVFEDSQVKFRAAAQIFQEFTWLWAQYKNEKWTETIFS